MRTCKHWPVSMSQTRSVASREPLTTLTEKAQRLRVRHLYYKVNEWVWVQHKQSKLLWIQLKVFLLSFTYPQKEHLPFWRVNSTVYTTLSFIAWQLHWQNNKAGMNIFFHSDNAIPTASHSCSYLNVQKRPFNLNSCPGAVSSPRMENERWAIIQQQKLPSGKTVTQVLHFSDYYCKNSLGQGCY